MRLTFLACVLASCAVHVGGQQEPVVNTTHGAVRGLRMSVSNVTLDVFHGIPFAKPPIGNLRFKRPEPVQAWENVLDARALPKSCYQAIDTKFNRFPGVEMWNPNTPLSEDCLYLNIWVPRLADGAPKNYSMATLVWIYGGSFSSGTSTLRVYDPRLLAADNDVIVVSLNYRMGALGFLYLGNSKAPGNMGLLDQKMALEWVYKNVDRFGGDPNRITIFGESAGASSVSYHLLSPLSRDFFNSAILESGSALCSWAFMTHEQAKEKAKKLAKEFNCPDGNSDAIANCLMPVDPATLSARQWNFVTPYLGMPFVPVVDGYFLPDTPTNLLKRGAVKNASLIAGVNKDEANYFLLYYEETYFPLHFADNLTRSQFLEVLKRVIPESNPNKIKAVTYEYETSYLPARRQSYGKITDDLSGDQAFKCPTIDFARAYSNLGADTYLYSFEHRVSVNPWPQWMGVMHGYEIEIVFGLPLHENTNYTQAERQFSSTVMRLWTNFAKTGNPSNGSVVWPKYTATEEDYLVLDLNIRPQKGLRYRQCAFWREIMPLFSQPPSGRNTGQGPKTCINGSRVEIQASGFTVMLITGALLLLPRLLRLIENLI